MGSRAQQGQLCLSGLIQFAKRIEALYRLKSALSGTDVVSIETACSRAQHAGVSSDIVQKGLAKAAYIRAEAQLLHAIQCGSVIDIASACRNAASANIPRDIIERGEKRVGCILSNQLSTALQSRDVAQIDQVCDLAEGLQAVDQRRIEAARASGQKYRAEVDLSAAIRSGDVANITEACAQAEAVGVVVEQIEAAYAEVARLRIADAERRLVDATSSGDQGNIQEAYDHACTVGVSYSKLQRGLVALEVACLAAATDLAMEHGDAAAIEEACFRAFKGANGYNMMNAIRHGCQQAATFREAALLAAITIATDIERLEEAIKPFEYNTIYSETMFLPMTLDDGTKVLVHLSGKEWYTDRGILQDDSPGLGFRRSKNFTDRDVRNRYATWGSHLEGVDAGDGWLQTHVIDKHERDAWELMRRQCNVQYPRELVRNAHMVLARIDAEAELRRALQKEEGREIVQACDKAGRANVPQGMIDEALAQAAVPCEVALRSATRRWHAQEVEDVLSYAEKASTSLDTLSEARERLKQIRVWEISAAMERWDPEQINTAAFNAAEADAPADVIAHAFLFSALINGSADSISAACDTAEQDGVDVELTAIARSKVTRIRKFSACLRCGCTRERDRWGDRICFCDTCRIHGCSSRLDEARPEFRSSVLESRTHGRSRSNSLGIDVSYDFDYGTDYVEDHDGRVHAYQIIEQVVTAKRTGKELARWVI